jgi:hypothetical protein
MPRGHRSKPEAREARQFQSTHAVRHPTRLGEAAAMSTQDEDAARAKQAQHIKALMKEVRESWPMQLELIVWKAKVAKARFDALRREGFEVGQALHLCVKDIEP